MIGAGDLAQDAAEREWDAMTPEEQDALLAQDAADAEAAAQEWQEIAERDAARYAADEDADAAYYAALMAEAERAQAAHIAAEDARVARLVQMGPYTYADPKCRQCRGTGVVSDAVDYGSTTAQLESPCECAVDYLWAVTDGDGIALEKDGLMISSWRINEGVYVLVGGGPDVPFTTAAALLDMCATIAPLTEWAVVWDDQGADDAQEG